MVERGPKPDLAAGPNPPADERSTLHRTENHHFQDISLNDDNHKHDDDHDHNNDRTLIDRSAASSLPAGPWGRKVWRYSVVSLVSVAVSQSVLLVTFGMLHWTARLANMVACAVATVPSYLNRSWTRGRRGRSRRWKEVVPFWALAFLGMVLSTWAADFAGTLAAHAVASHAARTAIVMTAALLTFRVLWIGKFAIFSTMLFSEHHSRDTAS
jgi:putative flippase GtrA